jgi:hypothetical protein
MKKGFLAICAVLLLIIASIAVLVPGCTPTTGTINVDATLDGSPWPSSGTGAVDYTLTGPGATAPTIINGTKVPDSFTGDPGSWTCAYVSGGPGTFVDITPSDTQSVAAGGTITFTLNFVTPAMPVDASIEFDTWTINGTPVPPTPFGPGTFWWINEDTVVDAHYKVQVGGNNTGKPVTLHETMTITAHNVGPEGEGNPDTPPIVWHVINGLGAVQTDPPLDVSNQVATHEGNPVPFCTDIPLPWCEPVNLDVECDVETEVGANFTKKVNWVRNPKGVNITEGLAMWDDSVFEIDTIQAWTVFTLVTTACEEVGEGFVDTDPLNNCSGDSPMIFIGVLPPGIPPTPLPPSP